MRFRPAAESFAPGAQPALLLVALVLVCLMLGLTGSATAAPTPQQRAKAIATESLIKKAGRLYTAKKFKEAGEALTEAQQGLSELENDDDPKQVAQLTANLRKQLTKAHGLLELEGVKLPPLEPAPAAGAKTGGGAGKVSFTKQVMPMLVGKCGRCHIEKSSGEFSMASYQQLMKGSKDGIVLFPGKGKTSRIVEMIENGDMPRGGGKVSAEELAALTKWIDEGAKFDGKNPAEPLSGAPAANDAPKPKLDVVQASGKEDVLFARDIGPVLLANCVGCHGNQNPRGRLGVDTFARLLQGGEDGLVITPGKPADSLLIKKLRGTGGGNRMPQGKPPLPEETIAKFEKWIAEGGKFDGPDPAQPLVQVVALVRAKAASHEDLSRERAQLAVKNWRLTLPDVSPDSTETEHFLFYGNVGEKELAEIARVAEEQVPKIEKLLKVPGEGPFIKGRLTIYVFQKHYDYGEVGTMLEQREIPTESRGHWRYNIVDAYACVVPPKHAEYSLAPLLGRQIASVYVAAQGNVPRWFAEGAGRAIAARLDPKDAQVRQWDDRVLSSLSGSGKPDDFLTGKLNPEDSDVLSYSYVKFLMTNVPKFNLMLTNVRTGMPFDQAFAKAYGGTPNQVAGAWVGRAGSKRGR